MVGKVVTKTGAAVWERGMLYKAVLQLVLMYGSKSGVVTRAMLKVLEIFHHRLARRITGMIVRRTTIREWERPLVAEALETAELWTIKEYIHQRQAAVVGQVVCWTIYELCTGAEGMPGTSKFMRWWEQDVGR